MYIEPPRVTVLIVGLFLPVACGNGNTSADVSSAAKGGRTSVLTGGSAVVGNGGAVSGVTTNNRSTSGGVSATTATRGGSTGAVGSGGNVSGTSAGGASLGIGGATSKATSISVGGMTSDTSASGGVATGGTTTTNKVGAGGGGGTAGIALGGTSSKLGAGGTTVIALGGTTALGGRTATGGTTVKPAVAYPYVFSVFNDSAAVSSLQIYTSNDALNFTLLADTGYTGPTGNLRDPSILLHTDGKFYVAFTTPPAGTGCCGAESSFSIASSSDLKKWTTVATVPSGIAGVSNVWAPEWYKDGDGSLHILVSVDQKTYRYEPTDATLTKFGAGTFIGIGPGYIDTFIVKTAGTYHAFAKKEATKFIEHATASTLDGPWTFVGVGDWAGWGTHREAQDLLQLDNGNWRLYCDGGSAGHEMYSDSSDGFKTWTAIKGLPTVGNNISHGTVIRGM